MSAFAKGMRIRVLKDNGRDNLVGFEGVVDLMTPSGVVVILENDPAEKFRMYNLHGFTRQTATVRRFFYPYEVKLV